VDGRQGLGGEAERVGAREAEPAPSPVHGQDPSHRVATPGRQAALWLPFVPEEGLDFTRRTVVPSGPKEKSTASMQLRIM
jgi:hypothetical protein